MTFVSFCGGLPFVSFYGGLPFASFCGGLPFAKLLALHVCRYCCLVLDSTCDCLFDHVKSSLQEASIMSHNGLVLMGSYFGHGGWLLAGAIQGSNSVVSFGPSESNLGLGVASTSSVTRILASAILLPPFLPCRYLYPRVNLLKNPSRQQQRRQIHF